jgi:biotin transporter BioY
LISGILDNSARLFCLLLKLRCSSIRLKSKRNLYRILRIFAGLDVCVVSIYNLGMVQMKCILLAQDKVIAVFVMLISGDIISGISGTIQNARNQEARSAERKTAKVAEK